MNKKSLVFLIAIGLSFFLINNYFTPKKNATDIAKQDSQKEQIASSKRSSNNEKANIRDFSLVKLYNSADASSFLSWGVQYDNDVITLASKNDLPDTLYFLNRKNKAQELELSIAPKGNQQITLYSSNDTSKLPTKRLSEEGITKLQLLSLDGKNLVDITTADYEAGRLYFPDGYPNKNAICFYESNSKYVPVGFYDASKQDFIPLSQISSFEDHLYYEAPITYKSSHTEEYYVLENDYQQVVFSTKGGAIAEINLPFKSKKDSESVVLPIQFDKILKKDYPQNDMFPSRDYFGFGGAKTSIVSKKPTLGGYYPLIRRDIKNSNGQIAYETPAKYYAMNVISDDPSTSNGFYKMTRMTKDTIQFEMSTPSRRITKTYSLQSNGVEAPYCLEVSIKVSGDTKDLYVTSGVPEVELISGNPAPIVKYRANKGSKTKVDKVSLPKLSTTLTSFYPDWVCNSNGFLGMILDPLDDAGAGFVVNKVPGNMDPTKLTVINAKNNAYPADKYPGYNVLIPLKNSTQPMDMRLYAGPFDQEVLKNVDAIFSNSQTGYNPRYTEAISFHGWFAFITEPFAKFLFLLMNFFHSITHSWGFSIILLTVALRVMLYPLNAWSIKSMAKNQQLQPKIAELQAKYKKDPKKLQMETMLLYKEYGVNPFTGCLPLLIQMPFLLAMFDLLKSTFALRGAPFIPGWIDNLTAPDVLFSWNYPIIFFGNEFHLLPFLLGGVMFVQQKITAASKTADVTDQQKQQQKMGTIMTIVFTVLFYNFPSGLNLYWLSSMSLAILQQWVTTKRMQKNIIPDEIVIGKKK